MFLSLSVARSFWYGQCSRRSSFFLFIVILVGLCFPFAATTPPCVFALPGWMRGPAPAAALPHRCAEADGSDATLSRERKQPLRAVDVSSVNPNAFNTFVDLLSAKSFRRPEARARHFSSSNLPSSQSKASR